MPAVNAVPLANRFPFVDYKYVERDEYEAESKVTAAKLKERVDEMIREAILRKSR